MSSIFTAADLSGIQFENPRYLHCYKDEKKKYARWDSLTERVKEKVKNYVRNQLDHQNVHTDNEVGVMYYCTFLQKGFLKDTIAVVYDKAILEVLRDMGVKRKFTLNYVNYYWCINFIYDYTT